LSVYCNTTATGFDLFIGISRANSQQEISIATTGVVCYNRCQCDGVLLLKSFLYLYHIDLKESTLCTHACSFMLYNRYKNVGSPLHSLTLEEMIKHKKTKRTDYQRSAGLKHKHD